GSGNPGKLKPVQAVFSRLDPWLEVRPVQVPSGVPDQPFGFDETARGAVARAENARRALDAEWGVGLEGGVEEAGGDLWVFGVAALARRDGRVSCARSAAMPLPPVVAERLRAGEELGPVIDRVSGENGASRGAGAFGFLTRGLVTRPEAWEQAIMMALAAHLRPELYPLPEEVAC
ncbi:MAG TPA: inosine/xanthosine triphosphatase, partial [Deinococcales bacterium]|nr:inosine/xanthosine triphosphatase [Deinococcales bacterium]